MFRRLFLTACSVLAVGFVHAQTCPSEENQAPGARAPIRNVEFGNDSLVPSEIEGQIAEDLREQSRPAWSRQDFSRLADEAADRVRIAYQNEGYFKATVSGKAVRVAGSVPAQYDIVVQIRDVDRQYRLGDLNIVHATAFPEAQLRDLFPMQRGDIFSRGKVVEGLDELRRLYGSEGYINFTSVPQTVFDDNSAIANVQIDTEEGKQFRLGNIQILGLDSETQARVLDSLDMKTGDIFSTASWQHLAEKFPDLSLDDPRVQNKRLNEKDGIVDILLDLRKEKATPCANSNEVVDATTAAH